VTCQNVLIVILTIYASMKHFVVSISSHPKTPLPKHLTWSMPMFSVTWIHLYLKEVTTFQQGQYFTNQNSGLPFSLDLVVLPHSEKQLLCMARAILKKSKVLVMDEVCLFVYLMSDHCR